MARRLWELDREIILEKALNSGMSISDLSEQMGCSRQYVSRILKTAHCSEKQAFNIATVLGCKTSEIVRWML